MLIIQHRPEECHIRLHIDQEAVGDHDVRVVRLRGHVALRDPEVVAECLLCSRLHRPQVHRVHDVLRVSPPLACNTTYSVFIIS